MTSTTIYVVYLTSYRGNKLPQFYIGSTSLDNISLGYRGSVSSNQYRKIWTKELREHPELFRTFIIGNFQTRQEAYDKEEKIQRILLPHQKPELYLNKSIAKSHGYGATGKKSREAVAKISGSNNYGAVCVVIDGVKYSTIKEASKTLVISPQKIRNYVAFCKRNGETTWKEFTEFVYKAARNSQSQTRTKMFQEGTLAKSKSISFSLFGRTFSSQKECIRETGLSESQVKYAQQLQKEFEELTLEDMQLVIAIRKATRNQIPVSVHNKVFPSHEAAREYLGGICTQTFKDKFIAAGLVRHLT